MVLSKEVLTNGKESALMPIIEDDSFHLLSLPTIKVISLTHALIDLYLSLIFNWYTSETVNIAILYLKTCHVTECSTIVLPELK